MFTVINHSLSILQEFELEQDAFDLYDSITDEEQIEGLRIDFEDDDTEAHTVYPR